MKQSFYLRNCIKKIYLKQQFTNYILLEIVDTKWHYHQPGKKIPAIKKNYIGDDKNSFIRLKHLFQVIGIWVNTKVHLLKVISKRAIDTLALTSMNLGTVLKILKDYPISNIQNYVMFLKDCRKRMIFHKHYRN